MTPKQHNDGRGLDEADAKLELIILRPTNEISEISSKTDSGRFVVRCHHPETGEYFVLVDEEDGNALWVDLRCISTSIDFWHVEHADAPVIRVLAQFGSKPVECFFAKASMFLEQFPEQAEKIQLLVDTFNARVI
jgi:hypothetical protein